MGEEHYRKRLPDTRRSITHHVTIYDQYGGEHDLYIRAGYYEDTRAVGELFINIGKQGSTLRGMLDAFSVMTSMAIQYGMPIDEIFRKLSDQSFEPSGLTDDPEVPKCSSVVDYAVRWLDKHRVLPS